MTLSAEATERLADIVSLQPTKNGELQDKWGLESGSEVHQYLENELSEYYYRDENSLIRATPDAADLVDVEPAIEGNEEGTVIRVPELQGRIFEILAGPDERSQSVVSVLQELRATFESDPEVDDVRSALQSLKRKGIVEIEYRTVPTFRKAAPRDDLTVETLSE
jgi:hypothetical protein